MDIPKSDHIKECCSMLLYSFFSYIFHITEFFYLKSGIVIRSIWKLLAEMQFWCGLSLEFVLYILTLFESQLSITLQVQYTEHHNVKSVLCFSTILSLDLMTLTHTMTSSSHT